MSHAEMRSRLSLQQKAVVQALIAGTAPPDGFDATQISVAAEALARKRQRGVAKAWPFLTTALADRFAPCFAAFAASTPLPEIGGPLADGHAFSRFLSARGEFPEEARLEAINVDLRFASTKRGLVPRRGFTLRLALDQRRRFMLGIRIPWLGVRWLRLFSSLGGIAACGLAFCLRKR
jgi:hypothetical protein